MTPKEKAGEIVAKMLQYQPLSTFERTEEMNVNFAKQCALIAVDEIMNQYVPISVSHFVTSYKSEYDFNRNVLNIESQIKDFTAYRILYWTQVKHEIEKL